ncbi:hypothetical protein PINS_up005792 [Pythium insidiosum]|nr:hypothetical protein PINS_up005792 [Pythium insidiosum]
MLLPNHLLLLSASDVSLAKLAAIVAAKASAHCAMECLYDEIAAIDSLRSSEELSALWNASDAADEADPIAAAWMYALEIPELQPTPSSSSSASSSHNNSNNNNNTSIKKRLTSRERQREEIRLLREQVTSLEAELTQLRVGRRAPSPDTTNVDPVMLASLTAFWSRRTAREQEARQRAVQENSRLRDAVARNVRVARSLERLIRQHVQFEVANRSLRDTQLMHRLNLLDDGYTRGIYTYLSARVRGNCSSIDARLTSSPRDPFHRVSLRCGAVSSDWFVETIETRVLPFHAHVVHRAAWCGMTNDDGDLLYGRFQTEEVLSDEVKSRVAISLPFEDTAISFHGWLVGRRVDSYINGTAQYGYVWCGWIIVDGLARGVMELVEDGWSRLLTLSPDDEMCLMQDLSRVRCVTTGDENVQDSVLTLIRAASKRVSECWNEKWERLLVGRRRQQPS